MNRLSGKRLLLGVTGGIAAYKAAELVRLLKLAGAEVRVVMTAAACEFITPLTMQALSGHRVHTDLLDTDAEAAMGHIELARWADAILVAPASADFIARLNSGRADDLLTTICLATEANVLIAPAMNNKMWSNSVTQQNIASLQTHGLQIIGPDSGDLACGETGPGRMVSPEMLQQQLADVFETGILQGLNLLITAGPTYEAIDPVRFIGNRSSGKMGYALAEAAQEAGANVVLISGPVALLCPERAKCINIESAAEMYATVMQQVDNCDIFIASAAVADYRPKDCNPHKIKKDAEYLTLELERNQDILSAVSHRSDAPFTLGFAAETEHLVKYAQAKRKAKGLDMIAANQVGIEGRGFDSENNELHLFWDGGEEVLPLDTKAHLARQLIVVLAQQYVENRGQTTIN
ncbi:MAG: bifunctional phosphopantothenoylcysteine decarboxylase/phosphopantothenate--cysteine ligase CoaBC [Gammaproteobacteria bacterium]|nr:bifunctional phosphopantothenoylcysteine decarboxylase/phosphopantothenate--cysteine ligase CoaBC [Gammaproteobacteria bacterium]